MNKQMTRDIISSAFNHNGEVFGGYVRDIIAGQEPKDIDVKFDNEKDALNFIIKLSKRYKIEIELNTYYGSYGVPVTKLKVKNDSYPELSRTLGIPTEIYVDVVVGDPWKHADLDVNMLRLTHCGIKSAAWMDIATILEHIAAKKARVLWSCTRNRQKKIAGMKARGWTLIKGR